ncbi:hypothetical protein BGHDH14_bgh00702 [Blumeria hordei DH14]|uniref:Uncharacterized protein n=1 Tax=Blumeria graminis f. sp. hordei (strain DH14) TaxID=546991 RepID=N1JGP1_BLUG1|nr:hypothetical protein BGHDH14_bgh00702 [Blumeria hordei DH14]
MASRRSIQVQPDYTFSRPMGGVINPPRSSNFPDVAVAAAAAVANYENTFYARSSATYTTGRPAYSPTSPSVGPGTSSNRPVSMYASNNFTTGTSSALYGMPGPSYKKAYPSPATTWDPQGRLSPESYLDDYMNSPNVSDYFLDSSAKAMGKCKGDGKGHSQQRRPSNRDEFDGPHQFLQRPPPEYIAQQERDLPHLPTNLVVHEQDSILTQVNDRLSQCAFDFVAKYQFPIPLANGEMRPVERPQDREWTEWVYLLKRLATKRRIPARVLYNGQIKQFITILENSLEMRHAAKHQSRPLKDDRNILQLISAGIQVAKILKDASAMDYLDRLYVTTEKRIQERSSARYRP